MSVVSVGDAGKEERGKEGVGGRYHGRYNKIG